MKGIYKLTINGRSYIGQDSYLEKNNRYSSHMSMLRRGIHFNKEMQNDFNIFGESNVSYVVLESSDEYSKEDLNRLEKFYIKKYGTFNSGIGYNRTKGGVGMLGYKQSDETLAKRSELVSGENNPQAKLSNDQFFEMVELFKKGKTNKEIGDIFGLHDRYISSIRHRKRFASLWDQVGSYQAPKSNGSIKRRKIDYSTFIKIVKMLENGETNASIQRKFSLSEGTGSRLRHRKIYKDFWEKYESTNGTFNDYRKDA